MTTTRENTADQRRRVDLSEALASGLGAFWRRVDSLLIAIFVALLIVWPWAYAVVPLLGAASAVLGIGSMLLARGAVGRRVGTLDREDALWLLALLGFAAIWLADVARTGVWPQARAGEGVWLPLWPVLAAGLLVWLRMFPPSRMGWWLGLSGGALGAGAIAGYERMWLGMARADNGINAIPFGNLSLLLGALALVAMLGRLSHSSRRSVWLTGLLGVAAAAGLTASLLSGTRGGWIALPLLGWLIYRTFQSLLRGRRSWLVAMLFGALLAGAVSLPQSGVLPRLGLAVENVQRYFSEEAKATSVGLRLEMWRAGVGLFLEEPLVGWGEGRLQAARDAWVAEGNLYPGVSRYDQLHSDIIDTAARRGLVGLIALAGLYGVPLLLFSRYLRSSRDPQSRALALSGLIVSVAFMDFGLTQSMLRDARGLVGYLGLSVIYWVLLKARCEVMGRGFKSRGRVLCLTGT